MWTNRGLVKAVIDLSERVDLLAQALADTREQVRDLRWAVEMNARPVYVMPGQAPLFDATGGNQ